MAVLIDNELCNGCGRCLKLCIYEAVELKEHKAIVNARCTSCGACLEACKVQAMALEIYKREVPDFTDRNGVWVLAEQRNGVLSRVGLELLGVGRKLADQIGQEVSAIVLGDKVENLIDELVAYGAQNILLAEDEALREYRTGPYTRVLSELIVELKPNILLIGATPVGRDLAPRVSMRLGLGLTADCTDLSIDEADGKLFQTRPAFGGNIMATIVSPYARPQMATVRPGVMESWRYRQPGKGRIIRKQVSLDKRDLITRILASVKVKKESVDLAEAKVVVACGRGVDSSEGMKVIASLAEVLGAGVGGTRVAVEQGWISADRQIGQTGQVIRPDLYIACGISGAIQHQVGMVGSKFAIAINKDKKAPIFQVVDWGIVGDLFEVIPALTKCLREKAC